MAADSRVHGGVDPDEVQKLGLDPASILDLSVNVNPFGPHPEVAAAVAAASLAAYPDRRATRPRRALGEALDCDPERIVLGHGSVELLWAVVASLAREGRGPLLIVGPTFGEPEAAARAHGLRCVQAVMQEADAFALDAGRIAAAIEREAPCGVYLCQPNNPSGRALGSRELQALIERHRDTCWILDQAFLSLSTLHEQLSLRFEAAPHVVAVRSLTKDHALAGLRVGYALASPAWIARIEAQRPPWTTSTLAQAAVVAAVRHPEHVARAREVLLAERRRLTAALARSGLHALPTETHYCLLRVSDADALRDWLLCTAALAVRSCSSFGLPHHVRVAARDGHATERLVHALAQYARAYPEGFSR